MNIYQRISEVRKKIDYIRKDATVQGYKAVTHDMVTAMVRDHLIDQGIVMTVSFHSSNVEQAGTTKSGTPIIRYEAVYSVRFVNVEDKDDYAQVMVEAHANDQGDKAPGKAMSYAVKYAILKTFNIETGENEESRVEGDRVRDKAVANAKDDAQYFLEQGDEFGVYLLSQRVGQEGWVEVFNAAKDGQKMAWKKRLREAEEVGGKCMTALNQALINDDPLGAKEAMDGMTEESKRLLANHLGREIATKLGKLVSEES